MQTAKSKRVLFKEYLDIFTAKLVINTVEFVGL